MSAGGLHAVLYQKLFRRLCRDITTHHLSTDNTGRASG